MHFSIWPYKLPSTERLVYSRSVYEPVSVRVFHEGRTECARATSMEKWN